MPPFVYSEVEELASKILKVETIPQSLLDILMQKSQGHPLYLRYMLNEIQEHGLEIATNLPVYDGEIENYYRVALQHENLDNAHMKHFLGLLARVSGSIKLGFVQEWKVDAQVMMDLKNKLHHLFYGIMGSELYPFSTILSGSICSTLQLQTFLMNNITRLSIGATTKSSQDISITQRWNLNGMKLRTFIMLVSMTLFWRLLILRISNNNCINSVRYGM